MKMVMQVKDDGGSEHEGSYEDGRQYPDLRDILQVESEGFSEGLDAGVRIMPDSRIEQWVEGGTIFQDGRAWGSS